MTREGRQNPPPSMKYAARGATFASLAASLMLGACSMSNDLLQNVGSVTADAQGSTVAHSDQSELQKATMYWGQEYTKKPAELQPALNYARNLKAMGEKQKALMVLQQASAFHGSNPELAGEYGRLALELDQVNVADRLLAAADDPSKPDWRIISARGTVFAKQGKYTEAIPFYQRALTLSANQPSVLNNLAMAHAMLGDAGTAESILRDAVNHAGATPKVRENLALVVDLQGRHDEASQIANLATPLATTAPTAHMVANTETPATFETAVARPAEADPAVSPALRPSTTDAPASLPPADVWQTDVAAATPAPAGP